MKRLIILLLYLIIQSCATRKIDKSFEESTYRLIINDIKKTNVFNDFKKNENKKCSNFSVNKFEYHFCEFTNFFKDNYVKRVYQKKCKKIDFSNLETDKINLDKFSDKKKSCFTIRFSQIIENRVIAEVNPINTRRKISNKSLQFLYEIKDKTIRRLEVVEIIHD